jgi:hypothetical protein
MNTAAIESSGLSKGREAKTVHHKGQKKASARSKAEPSAFDRIDFDASLERSLTELREGKVYEVDMKNPEESIRRILQAAK